MHIHEKYTNTELGSKGDSLCSEYFVKLVFPKTKYRYDSQIEISPTASSVSLMRLGASPIKFGVNKASLNSH